MSLLLDALKKAEKAKDDAKRRAQVSGSQPDEDETLIHVRTRNELPDISRPVEIHSEDIPGDSRAGGPDNPVPDAFYASPSPASAAELPHTDTLQDDRISRAPDKGRASPGSESQPDQQEGQRAAARKVFEAKFKEPNPKLPFYITMAILGAFAVGTVVYFWYQLRPPPPLVNKDPKPPADEKKMEAPEPRAAVANAVVPPTATQAPAIPGLPASPAASLPATVSAPEAAPAASVQPSTAAVAATKTPKGQAPAKDAAPARSAPEVRPTPRRPAALAAAVPAADPSKLSINRAASDVNPKVDAAWRAYNQGDLQTARSNYLEMLREEPSNRDALLGMAAMEIRTGRPELAEGYYRRLLEANPRDPLAQAGLLSLRTQTTDPVQAESRVKSLIANDPEANVLYFTLGNQYAQQGRWPEAQQAYFKAFSADPENPDFAYNLAVSLDQVKQPKLALEYYRRAIALAQQRSSSFDQALARSRAQELAR